MSKVSRTASPTAPTVPTPRGQLPEQQQILRKYLELRAQAEKNNPEKPNYTDANRYVKSLNPNQEKALEESLGKTANSLKQLRENVERLEKSTISAQRYLQQLNPQKLAKQS